MSRTDDASRDSIAAGVATAVARARAAQPGWNDTPVARRVQLLERVRAGLFARRRDAAAMISRETGKPEAEALVAEVLTTLDILRFLVRAAPRVLSPQSLRSSTLALWRKRLTITNEPFGVLGVISPWNYPLMLPAGHVAAGIITGNAVVLKPSELTPLTAELLAELHHDAGVPPDVFQVVHGAGNAGAALVDEADKVFFTGSVATGRRVAQRCAERLIPCSLELGGSDAAIVLEDADLAQAARGIAWGRFANAGQTCVAPKRVFVVDRVHDAFVRELQAHVGRLRLRGPGDDAWEVGPLIQPAALAPLERMRDDAVAQGAREVPLAAPSGLPGTFPPTLLLDVPVQAAVLHEEAFGPLLPIVRVRDADAAIAAANASPFGLSASVWSRSRPRGRAIAARLHAGTVALNDVAFVAGVAEIPHGGVKASGHGRTHGIRGLEECVRTRTVVDDILPSVRQPWWFPYTDDLTAQVDGYARLAHGRTWIERLSGIGATLRLLLRR